MLEAWSPAVVLSALSPTGGFSRMSLLACAQRLTALVDISSAPGSIIASLVARRASLQRLGRLRLQRAV